MTTQTSKSFRLGQIVATPAALRALEQAGQDALHFIRLHAALDPGTLDADDQKANERAIAHEGDLDQQERVFSAFKTKTDVKIWVITETDRSVTTILLPSDY